MGDAKPISGEQDDIAEYLEQLVKNPTTNITIIEQ